MTRTYFWMMGLLVSLAAQNAMAEVWLDGGISRAQTGGGSAATQYEQKSGLGAQARFRLGGGGALDLAPGIGMWQRKFAEPGTTSEVSTQSLQFSLLARLWVGRMIAFGVGPYYNLGFGAVGANPSLAGLRSREGGLLASFTFQLFPFSKFAPFFQAQYGMGLLDGGSSSASKYRDTMILAGIRLGGWK